MVSWHWIFKLDSHMVHWNVHQPHVSLLLFTKEVNSSMSTYSHCCFDIVCIKNCIGLNEQLFYLWTKKSENWCQSSYMIHNINAPNMNNVNLKSDFRLIFFQGFIEIKRTIWLWVQYTMEGVNIPEPLFFTYN
jgi:hypothetical protein